MTSTNERIGGFRKEVDDQKLGLAIKRGVARGLAGSSLCVPKTPSS
jgi:hypothetical protein